MKNRKRVMQFLLMAGISLVCAGCGSSQSAAPAGTSAAPSQGTSVREAALEETKAESAGAKNTGAENTGAETKSSEATTASGEGQEAEAGKALVVYFSCTGNTKAIAESIADGLSADLYEIVAANPYTAADLDYGDNSSRSTKEMKDSSARPVISGSVEDMGQYKTVYIGYPIWWGEAPRILDTFVESYDFTDKTVVPFCTSASSGVGSSAKGLEERAGSGSWLDGKRFKADEDGAGCHHDNRSFVSDGIPGNGRGVPRVAGGRDAPAVRGT